MSSLDVLYKEHRELLRLAGELVALTGTYEIPQERALVDCRRELAQLIQAHLKRESELVLAPLRESPDPAHRALASRYVRDLLDIRLASTAHHGKWGIAAALADMTNYHVSVRALVKSLAARLEWEEAELFPAAERVLAKRLARRAA